MITTVITLAVAILCSALLIIFLIMRLVSELDNVKRLSEEKEIAQEKRIEEIKSLLKTIEAVNNKLTEIAGIHASASGSIEKKIDEAIEILNGNQYAIMNNLQEILKNRTRN